jgi:hypothetical protein
MNHSGMLLTEEDKVRRIQRIEIEWDEHKFRRGEYFDRFLSKLLDKYDIDLRDYYRYMNLARVKNTLAGEKYGNLSGNNRNHENPSGECRLCAERFGEPTEKEEEQTWQEHAKLHLGELMSQEVDE